MEDEVVGCCGFGSGPVSDDKRGGNAADDVETKHFILRGSLSLFDTLKNPNLYTESPQRMLIALHGENPLCTERIRTHGSIILEISLAQSSADDLKETFCSIETVDDLEQLQGQDVGMDITIEVKQVEIKTGLGRGGDGAQAESDAVGAVTVTFSTDPSQYSPEREAERWSATAELQVSLF